MKIEREMVCDYFPRVLLYCKRCWSALQRTEIVKLFYRESKYSNKILVILAFAYLQQATSLANFTIRIILFSPGRVLADNSYFIFYNSIKVHDIPVRITSENIGKMRDYNGIFINKPYRLPSSRKALYYRTEIFSIINFPIHQVQSSDENQNGKSNQNHFLCLTHEYISGL